MKVSESMPSITIRIDDETAAQVDELAGAMDRSRSWIADAALQRYLQEERKWLQDIRAGIDELDRGEAIPHEQVMSEIREKISVHQKKGG